MTTPIDNHTIYNHTSKITAHLHSWLFRGLFSVAGWVCVSANLYDPLEGSGDETTWSLLSSLCPQFPVLVRLLELVLFSYWAGEPFMIPVCKCNHTNLLHAQHMQCNWALTWILPHIMTSFSLQLLSHNFGTTVFLYDFSISVLESVAAMSSSWKCLWAVQ